MRSPDIAGDFGKAWEVPLDRMAGFAAQHPEKVEPWTVMTTVGLWYLNGKQFHPLWQWWMVAVVSLEDIPGAPPAIRQYPNAQWELLLHALDPTQKTPPVNGEGPAALMLPPKLVVHFHGLERSQAHAVGRFVAEAFCAGRMTPEGEWARKNLEAVVRLVNDYYVGRFGGKVRTFPLEVDPFSNRFTGEVDRTVNAWGGLDQ